MNRNSEGSSELRSLDKLLGFRQLVDELGQSITDLKEIIPTLTNSPKLDPYIEHLERINSGFTQILENRPINNGPVFTPKDEEAA